MRRLRRGSITSELIMCGGGVRCILLLPLVAIYIPRDNRCIYMAHGCFYVCCCDWVGSVGMLLCSGRC